jgi:hypothetical protein
MIWVLAPFSTGAAACCMTGVRRGWRSRATTRSRCRGPYGMRLSSARTFKRAPEVVRWRSRSTGRGDKGASPLEDDEFEE